LKFYKELTNHEEQLIVLSPNDLTCYSSLMPNVSHICDANKCIIKTLYSNPKVGKLFFRKFKKATRIEKSS